jgi:hypothetical protein
VNHAQDRRAVLDQGDVDGELAVALDELLGAVQRIDQPVAPPGAAGGIGDVAAFLGQAGDVGRQSGQAVFDDLVRGQVGGGQGTVVVFVRDVECATVDRQDRFARILGKRDQRREQVIVIVRGTVGH